MLHHLSSLTLKLATLIHCFCSYSEGKPLSRVMIDRESIQSYRTPYSRLKTSSIPENEKTQIRYARKVQGRDAKKVAEESLNRTFLKFSNVTFSSSKGIKNIWEQVDVVLIRTVPVTRDHLLFLQTLHRKGSKIWIQFWRHPDTIKRHADFWISPENFDRYVITLLRLLKIHFEIIKKELPMSINIENYNEVYHSLTELNSELRRLVTIYDSILSTEVIGKSAEGRPIEVVHLRVDNTRMKPIIFLLCGSHAREWLAVSSCQYTLRRLVFDHKYDNDVIKLLEHFDVAMIPMLNPDGYVYTREKWRLWRKTRSTNHGTLCSGVDLNRNFNYRWGGGGTSSKPCSAIYCGRRPFSESESLAVGKYVYHLRRNIAAFIDVHTYGQMWMSPWGFSKQYPQDYRRQESAMKKIHKAIKKETGEHYQYGRSFTTLYQTSGTAMDWAYGFLSITHSYGIELRPNIGTRYMPFERSPREIIPSGTDLFTGVKTLAFHMIQENKPRKIREGHDFYFDNDMRTPFK